MRFSYRSLCSRLTSFTAAFFLIASAALAQVGNNISDAIQLVPGSQATFGTPSVNYNLETNEPSANGNKTIWFRWSTDSTPPSEVMFSTYGSAYDTTIRVYEYPVDAPAYFPTNSPALTPLGTTAGGSPYVTYTQDDVHLGTTTGNAILTNPAASTVYFFCVGQNGGAASGTINLQIQFGPRPVSNDGLAGAIEFTTNLTSPATQVLIGSPTNGTTIAATSEGLLLTGCATTRNTPTVTCASTTGLVVGMPVTGGGIAPTNLTVASITNATTFVLSGNVTSNSATGLTLSAGGENSPSGDSDIKAGSVWYRYTVGATPHVFSVAIENLPADVAAASGSTLQIWSNPSNALTSPASLTTGAGSAFIAQSTNNGLNGQPRIVVNATASTTYYIRVASTTGSAFPFSIVLDAEPAQTPPGNDSVNSSLAFPYSLSSTLPVPRVGGSTYSATNNEVAGTTIGNNTDGANLWYSWKAPASGMVTVRSLLPNGIYTSPNGTYPEASTFRFDCEVFFDRSDPRNNITPAQWSQADLQTVASFSDANASQFTSWYAIKDVVYLIGIGGDSTSAAGNAGRGYFSFTLENNSLTTLARSGVSYGNEGVIKTLSRPVLNSTGSMVFQAGLELGGPVTNLRDTAIYHSNGSSGSNAVVVEGNRDLVSTGSIFSSFSSVSINDASSIDFTGTLLLSAADPATIKANSLALYNVNATGTLISREVRLGDYAGASYTWGEGGGFLSQFNPPARANDDGAALFSGKMTGTPVDRDSGLFVASSSLAGKLVILEEDPAPGTQDGTEFGDWTGTPSVNANNFLATLATLRGPGVSAANNTGLYTVRDYTSSAPAWSLRLRTGLSAGSTAGGAVLSSLSEPRVNSAGRIALLVNFKIGTGAPSTTSGNDTAILSDLNQRPGLFATVAREGEIARNQRGVPLTSSAKFATFNTPVLITNNGVIFSAKLTDGNTGIWIWNGQSLFNTALTGSDAPSSGSPSGLKFATLGTPLCSIYGHVAFTATLTGTGVTSANNAGLWAVAEDGSTPVLRLRKGDTYNFHSEQLPFRRTITSIDITPGSGGDDGFPRGMDANGNMGVVVTFSKNGSEQGRAIIKVAP
jgi:hypothetical protein